MPALWGSILMRREAYQIRRSTAYQIPVVQIGIEIPHDLSGLADRTGYCGLVCGGGVVCGAGVAAGGVIGFFATGFFFTAGFLGGSLSSTTVFFGGAAGMAACAVFKSARRRTISCSFDAAKVFIRSAICFRVASKLFRSLDSAWKSSFGPNAPADSTTPLNTS